MHKDFYASGFLYHPASQQILLQQQVSSSKISSAWLLFGATRLPQENTKTAFQRLIRQLLGVKLNLNAIYPVYFYPSPGRYKNHHIVYAEVKRKQNFSPRSGFSFSWFTSREIAKLPLGEQTKHDLIVGQRVIDALARRRSLS